MARIKEERSVTGWKRVEYIKDALDLNNTEFKEGFRNAIACQSNSFFTNAKKTGVPVKEVRRFAKYVGIDYDLFFTEEPKEIEKFERLVEKYREIKKYSPIDERVEKLTLDEDEERNDDLENGDNELSLKPLPEKKETTEQSHERLPKTESPAEQVFNQSSNNSMPYNCFSDKKETTQRQANQSSEKAKPIKQSFVQPQNKEKPAKQRPDKKRTIKKPSRLPNKKEIYEQGGCDRTGVIKHSYGWTTSKEASFTKIEKAKNSKIGCLGMIGRGLLCGVIGSLLPLLLALIFDFPDLASAGVILLFMIMGILIGYLFPNFFGVN